MTGRDANGKFIKGSKVNLGRVPSTEQRRKQAEKMTGRVESDEHKEKIRNGMLTSDKVIGRPKGGTPWNKGMKRINGDPIPAYEYRFSEEGRRKRSEASKTMWANYSPERKSELIRGMLRVASPNKWELRLGAILDEMYPGDWKFVGDGQVVIAGKCPDFINVNGQKKIIELYGEHWHQGDNPRDRQAIFKPFGYNTLVVWAKELGNKKALNNRLKRFCKPKANKPGDIMETGVAA